jgi:hypothetical protein
VQHFPFQIPPEYTHIGTLILKRKHLATLTLSVTDHPSANFCRQSLRRKIQSQLFLIFSTSVNSHRHHASMVSLFTLRNLYICTGVARFFLAHYTKTGKNVPNEHKMYQNGHKMYQNGHKISPMSVQYSK